MSHFDVAKAQPSAWSILSRSYHAGRVASTYLLSGQEGLGHWPLAIEFAALLNCQDVQRTGDPSAPVRPCGECHHCRMTYDLNFEGLQIVVPVPPHKNLGEAIELTTEAINAKKAEPFKRLTSSANMSVPIDMAREAARRLSLKASDGIIRVVLLYRLEDMRASSADALLKLIEEPPSDTVLIMTAERPEMLLPTIQSRAQRIRLRRLPDSILADYLVSRYDIPEKRAMLISRLAQGVPGIAVDLAGDDEDESASKRAVAMLLFKALFRDRPWNVIAEMQDMVSMNNRGEVDELLRHWQSLLRDGHYFAVTGSAADMVNIDFSVDLEQLSPALSDPVRVDIMMHAIKNTVADCTRNVHIQTALAALSLKLMATVKAAG